jgi:dTDP-4-amino-4,6-dideoxygalactose transaminase
MQNNLTTSSKEEITVTKPYLPPQAAYIKYIEQIWSRRWLTNDGPLLQELETRIKAYLGLNHFAYLANGTLALQLALKALNVTGEVITTPFSYVATTSAIAWENCIPVMADIDERTLNINPDKIRPLITDKTTAILATHVYGNSCDIEKLQEICDEYKLSLIFDAAHAFGVKYKGKSLYSYGDLSAASFHATKLFHTIEGGGLFTNNKELMEHVRRIRNFGHTGVNEFGEIGINAKNSEFHAAMGLCNLDHIDQIIAQRKKLSQLYDENLTHSNITRPTLQAGTDYNYSYYPIIFKTEAQLLAVQNVLMEEKISTRRYFYPSLSSLPYVKKQNTPIADDISSRVMCLPLYPDLKVQQVSMITTLINNSLKSL